MTSNRLSWRMPRPTALLLAALASCVGSVEFSPQNPASQNPASQNPASQDPASQDPVPQDPGPQDQASKPATKKLTLASISWLSGHWRSKSRGSMTEELWMPARGRIMLGLNRSVRGKAHGSFEYLRIVQTKKDTYYWASPGGSKPTPFKMTKATKNHVVFENPKHDFPKRIEYRRKGDKLTAQIFGDKPGPTWTLERIGDVK